MPSDDGPYVPLLVDEEENLQNADTTDAREQWDTYGEMHPLLEDELP